MSEMRTALTGLLSIASGKAQGSADRGGQRLRLEGSSEYASQNGSIRRSLTSFKGRQPLAINNGSVMDGLGGHAQ